MATFLFFFLLVILLPADRMWFCLAGGGGGGGGGANFKDSKKLDVFYIFRSVTFRARANAMGAVSSP